MARKLIDIAREGPAGEARELEDRVPAGFAVVRWQVRIFGWHCLTLYRHDVHIEAPKGNPDPTVHLRTWWLYVLGEWGVGLHVPVKVAKWLGLSAPDWTDEEHATETHV